MEDWLYLDCPCTSFPRSFARDYKETYRYPPPSTVYGCLLSLVGEEDLTAHLGVKVAIGIIGDDVPISRIVRKQRHHKFSKKHQGVYSSAQFSKPNFQELLTGLRLVLRLNSTEETADVTLADRVAIALTTPGRISRFGGLSLGESWAMVNGIRSYRESDGSVRWLVKDPRGLIGLPVWIDRSTTRGTFQRFTLSDTFEDCCWVSIQEPYPADGLEAKLEKRTRA
ncbi:type I-MYXAN CRISPR-associated protein Cas5/Cmx5/DevS [Synechococcus sp. PCC 7336]|uniref:type I-MYXAN CRISPR-associated protein Cas5/Cmx5/DevS n=1 Tax=Synechococcus sp. PCC 7336 TaxID=195250 RepID=UPI0003464ED2|nr:type I-MYXAN CRISPR-associated protein Cas5/Cmx5/DevS [Synechococcus sp. PCC 7336]